MKQVEEVSRELCCMIICHILLSTQMHLKTGAVKKKGKKLHHLRRDQNPNSVNNYEPSNNEEKKNVTNAGQPNSHS